MYVEKIRKLNIIFPYAQRYLFAVDHAAILLLILIGSRSIFDYGSKLTPPLLHPETKRLHHAKAGHEH